MDTNIIFKLYKDTINVSQIKKDVDYKSLNNTNVIDVKELKFSIAYIIENFELVSNFLNVVILKKNIVNVTINDMDIAEHIIDLINTWEHIKKVTFKQDKKVPLDVVLKILNNKYIETIDCYEMSSFLIERLDLSRHLKVTTRHKITDTTRFMQINNLNSFSDLYYRKVITIDGEFNPDDFEDFRMFIATNEKLKTIRIINYSNELLTSVIKELESRHKKDITIFIYEEGNDLNTIYNSVNYLKRSYRRYFEEYNIKFKLSYSKEYKSKNFMKEFNLKILLTIISLIVLLGAIIVGINYYQQYHDQTKVENQMEDILDILNEAEEYTTIDDNENDIEIIDVGDDDNDTTELTTKKPGSNYVSAYYTNFEQVFEKLNTINPHTVGWLTVNNTKINYPVTQYTDNSYYLNHDFYKKKNSMGWIFMDYRNDPTNLNKNTIIYGHNIKGGIMFGTIKTMMNSSWYKNSNNQIITFNTPSGNMKWQIFSLYKIPATDDYIKTEFDTNEEYMNFINMLKSRSLRDFGVEVNENSKILTLSTCFSHTTRHVVHAVLIEDTTTNPVEETVPEETPVEEITE